MIPRLTRELEARGHTAQLLTGSEHRQAVGKFGEVEVVHGSMHDVRLGYDLWKLSSRYKSSVFYSPHFRAFSRFPGRQFVTVHDLIYLRCNYPLHYRAYVRAYLRRLAMSRVKVIAISEATRAELVREISDLDVTVIRNGVEAQAPAPTEFVAHGDRMDVLYVGDTSRHKNLDTLVAAIDLARRHGSAIRLTVAGSRSERGNLPSFVDLCHRPSDAQLADLYRRAIAVVHPSLMEGFSLVPFEAAGHGTPIVVSRIPAHIEMLGDAVDMFAPHDVDTLAMHLRRLAEDSATWAASQKRSIDLTRSHGFSWDDTATRVADLLTA
jgi:glycosyltransferase involved in cell wall biosynthesis